MTITELISEYPLLATGITQMVLDQGTPKNFYDKFLRKDLKLTEVECEECEELLGNMLEEERENFWAGEQDEKLEHTTLANVAKDLFDGKRCVFA